MKVLETLKKAGVKLFQKVGSVRHAVHAAKVGYDGIYAAGFEEGGHPLSDDVTTMVLLPRVVESVKIPVVAVGGIADGRTMAAALTLGAQGVMMASRFIATKECQVHENIKNELVKRQEFDTTIYGQSTGKQGRGLKTKAVEEILILEGKGGGLNELLPLISGEKMKEAWEKGIVESAPLAVGQSIGLIKEVMSCQNLLDTMARDAEESLARAKKMVG